MARSKAGTFEQFKINGTEVKVGDVLAYVLGKKTKSFGSYVGTPGPANITVIDGNGRNEGKPMYVNQWKVLGFYVPPAADEQVAPVADEQVAEATTVEGAVEEPVLEEPTETVATVVDDAYEAMLEAGVDKSIIDLAIDESMIDLAVEA